MTWVATVPSLSWSSSQVPWSSVSSVIEFNRPAVSDPSRGVPRVPERQEGIVQCRVAKPDVEHTLADP